MQARHSSADGQVDVGCGPRASMLGCASCFEGAGEARALRVVVGGGNGAVALGGRRGELEEERATAPSRAPGSVHLAGRLDRDACGEQVEAVDDCDCRPDAWSTRAWPARTILAAERVNLC